MAVFTASRMGCGGVEIGFADAEGDDAVGLRD
jgi:hypothetical protein